MTARTAVGNVGTASHLEGGGLDEFQDANVTRDLHPSMGHFDVVGEHAGAQRLEVGDVECRQEVDDASSFGKVREVGDGGVRSECQGGGRGCGLCGM